MHKTLRISALGLPLVAAAVLLSAPTANAAKGDCPVGSFCAWQNDNFGGTRADWPRGTNDPDWWNNQMHDNAESMYNRAASSTTIRDNVRTYKDINYGRFGVCVEPGETYDAGMNDNDYDSHEWVHSC